MGAGTVEHAHRGTPRPRWAVLAVLVDLATVARDAGSRWVDDACYRMGASLAFYAAFSIFPLALLAVTGIGFLLGNDDSVRERALGWFAGASTREVRGLLDQTLQSMQSHRAERGIGVAIGLVTLVFGASGVFSELENALDVIWRVRPSSSGGFWSAVTRAVKAKAVSFGVVVATATALLASLVVTTALGAFGEVTSRFVGARWPWLGAEACASFGLLTVLLATTYRMIPHARVSWRDVIGAAVVTSLLFTGLKSLLAWYLAGLGSYAAYGAVGAVLGLLTWIYVAALILLYGAEFSRVYAERSGSIARAARSSRGRRRTSREDPAVLALGGHRQ
jgi:membrane protein